MARIKKNTEKHHVRTIRSDGTGRDELILIGGGRHAYIWTAAGTFSGAVTLRTLAYDILREVGFNRKNRRLDVSATPDDRASR